MNRRSRSSRIWCRRSVCVVVAGLLSVAGCQQAPASAPGEAAIDPAEPTAQPGDGPETTADLAARAAQALRAGLDPARRPPGTPTGAPAEVYEAPPLPAADATAPVRVDAGAATIRQAPPSSRQEPSAPGAGTPPTGQPVTGAEPTPAPNPVPTPTPAPAPGPTPSTPGHAVTGDAPSSGSAFKVVDLALCSRIEGFGKYTRLPTVRLRVGRPLPLLVYTELDGFAHAPAGGSGEPPQWAIQVGQEVAIYRVSQAPAAPGKPPPPDELVRSYREELCRDVAPRKRRDHYLVQRIELPGTLTPGQYTVKVTLRDVHSGEVTEAAATITVER